MKITGQPEQFGRVAVLMGGIASEREISLRSGKAVYDALLAQGVDAIAVDIQESFIAELKSLRCDRVFNIVHGRGGEDGVLQGILQDLNLPYTGSGVMASALAMDKLRTKMCWKGVGLPTPDWQVIRQADDIETCIAQLGFPMIVKPSQEGSSLGMSQAKDKEELMTAWVNARQYDCEVYAERWVFGREYTVGVLQQQALPLVGVQTTHSFYDYEAKYFSDTTRYHCPSGLEPDVERQLQVLALEACSAIGVTGWGRVDLFLEAGEQPQLIEVNTVPGMTDHSLVPMAAKAADMSFEELVWRILETSLDAQ